MLVLLRPLRNGGIDPTDDTRVINCDGTDASKMISAIFSRTIPELQDM